MGTGAFDNTDRCAVLWVALAVLAAVCVFQYHTDNTQLGDAIGAGDSFVGLSNEINPNVAAWSSLARLPGIGRVRAEAIVEYRSEFCREGTAGLAFSNSNDLDNVKGIGPVTVRQIGPYLTFRTK